MPKLPDIYDLGQRPTPVNRRGIAQTPNVGAVGEAIAGLGSEIAQIGQQKLEAQDKLSYAKAKAHLLREDIAARQELEKDPSGYATWESRYGERMKKARGEAAKMIQHRGDRAAFDLDADLDVQRGLGEIAKGARIKLADDEVSKAGEADLKDQDAYQLAKDEDTRVAILGAVKGRNQALYERGFVTKKEQRDRDRKFVSENAKQRVEALMEADEWDEAGKVFGSQRQFLDPDEERVIETALARGKRRQGILIVSDEIVNGVRAPVEPGSAPKSSKASVPIAGYAAFHRAIIAQESGGRYGVKNAEGSGATGLGQIMPDTAKALSRKLGLPYRPDLLAGTSKAAREYQDKLTAAATAEAWEYGGGDVAKAAAYYHSGPNKRGWKEKTAKYQSDIKRRMGQAEDHQAPREHNLDNLYDQVDARAKAEGWSVEYTEEVKAEVARKVQRNEALYEREQRDIMEQVLVKADALGEGLTDPSQLGANFYRLSPTNRLQIKDMIRARKEKGVEANGDTALILDQMKTTDPAGFAKLDPRLIRGKVSDAEFSTFLTDQRKIAEEINSGKFTNNDSAIMSVINRYAVELGITGEDIKKKGDKRDRYFKLKKVMEERLNRLTGGTRAPTEAEIKGAFDWATMTVMQDGEETTRFEVETGEGRKMTIPVPLDIKQRIIRGYVSQGLPVPSREQIAKEYLAGKGRPGFW